MQNAGEFNRINTVLLNVHYTLLEELSDSGQEYKNILLSPFFFFFFFFWGGGGEGLFRKDKTCIIAKFHRNDLVSCYHYREGKYPIL